MMTQLRVFGVILQRQVILLSRQWLDNFLDSIFWPIISSFVFAYVLPRVLDVSSSYGALVFVGWISTTTLIVAFVQGQNVLRDIQFTGSIEYYQTLPLSSWLMVSSFAVCWIMRIFWIVIPLIPIGKLVMYHSFDLACFSPIKFVLALFCMSWFSSFLALSLVAVIPNTNLFDHVYGWVLDPLAAMGGQFFTWVQVAVALPAFAPWLLINPVMHGTESLRVSFFGQQEHLPYWTSIAVVIVFSLFITLIAIKLMKRRLDFV